MLVADDKVELRALLAAEMRRHLHALRAAPGAAAARTALHALRGSAALAGEHDLALVLAQYESRLRAGEVSVVALAERVFESAAERLEQDLAPFVECWPEPPSGLGASSVDPRYRLEYRAAVRDRLHELGALIDGAELVHDAVPRAYRAIHAIKGAANAVGDDTTAWYCHGLEAWLKSEHEEGLSVRDLLEPHCRVLALFSEDPDEALAHLRRSAGSERALHDLSVERRARAPRRQSRPPVVDGDASPEHLLHVPSATIDRLVDGLERIDLVHDELRGTADSARQMAARMRDLRGSLHGALRLIGPARPWGAPVAALQRIEASARALGLVAESAERSAQLCRRNAETVHARSGEMRLVLAGLRRTSVGWLFERVASAVDRFATAQGRLVEVTIAGADLPMDRRIAERLFDPVMQLARNAVAHGIQPPELREQSGKPAAGVLRLAATRIGDWLRIIVEDDGRGVDTAHIRELARAHGGIGRDLLESAHDDELLTLLFLPGLTTQRGADLLAGRGVGLDLVRDAVRRLGGAIRLGTSAAGGLSATIEVPGERGLLDVVWVEAAEHEFALPITFTGRVSSAPVSGPVAGLAGCLGLPERGAPRLALELSIHGVQAISIAIDAVGAVEETNVRPIPSLVAALGPYSGAILRGDGSLRLVLDAALLAARAWAQASRAL